MPPMAVRLAADLRPSADGSAVCTWLSHRPYTPRLAYDRVMHTAPAGSQRAYNLGQLRA